MKFNLICAILGHRYNQYTGKCARCGKAEVRKYHSASPRQSTTGSQSYEDQMLLDAAVHRVSDVDAAEKHHFHGAGGDFGGAGASGGWDSSSSASHHSSSGSSYSSSGSYDSGSSDSGSSSSGSD